MDDGRRKVKVQDYRKCFPCLSVGKSGDVIEVSGHKERDETEGEGDETRRRRLADGAQSMSGGEGGESEIGLLHYEQIDISALGTREREGEKMY